jgi:hypothetical protein
MVDSLGETKLSELVFSIHELSQHDSIGTARVYEEIGAGRPRAIKIGRRTRIVVDDGEACLLSRPSLAAATSRSRAMITDLTSDAAGLLLASKSTARYSRSSPPEVTQNAAPRECVRRHHLTHGPQQSDPRAFSSLIWRPGAGVYSRPLGCIHCSTVARLQRPTVVSSMHGRQLGAPVSSGTRSRRIRTVTCWQTLRTPAERHCEHRT